MKKWINKYWIWIIIALLLVVGGPILINELYKTEKGYRTLWGASEVLSYYGMIIAAIGGAIGVFLSIKYSQKQYLDDTKKRVLPYLFVTRLNRYIHYNIFGMNSETPNQQEDNGYKEYKIDNIYYILTEKKIESVADLTPEQRTILEQDGKIWEDHGSSKTLVQKEYISMPFEIENIGNGAAIELRIGFNKIKDDKKYIFPISLKPGNSIYLHIFSCEPYEKIKGEYILEFYYTDIFGNCYQQEYPVEIGMDEKHEFVSSIDLSGTQKENIEIP